MEERKVFHDSVVPIPVESGPAVPAAPLAHLTAHSSERVR